MSLTVDPQPDDDAPLRLEQQILLDYRFVGGHFASTFFRVLLEEQRILGRRCPQGHVLVPPRPVCGLCNTETDAWIEVGPTGRLAGFTVVYTPFTDPMTGEERPVPYGFGLIQFDGADTSVYHLVDETDPRRLHVGLAVEPVWRDPEERTGSLADIRWFRPAAREERR